MPEMQTLARKIADLYRDRPHAGSSEVDRVKWFVRKAVLLEEIANRDPHSRDEARQAAATAREHALDLIAQLVAAGSSGRRVA